MPPGQRGLEGRASESERQVHAGRCVNRGAERTGPERSRLPAWFPGWGLAGPLPRAAAPLASSRSAASTVGPGLGSLPPEASVSHSRGLRDITHVTRLIPWIPGPTCGEDLACVASWCFDYSSNV